MSALPPGMIRFEISSSAIGCENEGCMTREATMPALANVTIGEDLFVSKF